MNRWPLLAVSLLVTGCILTAPIPPGTKGCAGCPPADEPTRAPIAVPMDVAAASVAPTPKPTATGSPATTTRAPAVPTASPTPACDVEPLGKPAPGTAQHGAYNGALLPDGWTNLADEWAVTTAITRLRADGPEWWPCFQRHYPAAVTAYGRVKDNWPTSAATPAAASTANPKLVAACDALRVQFNADTSAMFAAAVDAERAAQAGAFGGSTGSGADLAAIKAENSRKMGERQAQYNQDRAELGCDLLPTPTPSSATATPAPSVFAPTPTPMPSPTT